MKIGAMIESFRLGFREAAAAARKAGASGVQAYASGTINADMTDAEIAEVRRILDGEGLEISAVCGDFGCRMFYLPDESRDLIEKEKRVMSVARKLGTSIVTTHIGVVPEDTNCRQYETMHRVCRELAECADSEGGKFAVETGPEKSAVLKAFLDSLGSRGVSVNLDPANLVMCAGDDPVEAVANLKDYIVHTHAKDGVQKFAVDTRRIYAAQYFGLEPAPRGSYLEVPLGKGGVPWKKYIAALKDIGYDGYLTIEREVGDDPMRDIVTAVEFLKTLI